jgi:hypothetical protein
MASSRPGRLPLAFLALLALLVLPALAATRSPIGAAGAPALASNAVRYRYRFGGEVVAHVLENVTTVTEYRRPEAVDQVVLGLENGDFYVLNADILVDYNLAPEAKIERRQVMNQLFNHYDPYLQAEKQGWHREWVDEQYLKWAGRLPTDSEWLEAFNELTRGVEHHQMERWIQYSPPAIRHSVDTRFESIAGRPPTEAEVAPFYARLLAGEPYPAVEKDLALSARKLR